MAVPLRNTPPGWSKECGVCRRRYDAARWQTLGSVATVPSDSVQKHLTVSASWTVDLRRCACGAVLAARNPREP